MTWGEPAMANPLTPGLRPPRGGAASAPFDNLASCRGDWRGLSRHCHGEMTAEQSSSPLGTRRGLEEIAATASWVEELPKGTM